MIKIGDDLTELEKFKQCIFSWNKWKSDVEMLESEGMPNPFKNLGVQKNSIASYLGKTYSPLSIASPTVIIKNIKIENIQRRVYVRQLTE